MRNVKDPKFLAWVRKQACIVCVAFGLVQFTPTEAAHVGLRGLGQKCSDREAIPLCRWHHREGSDSHHVAGRRFWEMHKLDRAEVIARTNERYETATDKRTV